MAHGIHGVMLGGVLALAGVAVVELLIGMGLRPLSPAGWPGLGMFAGTALGGMPGFAGGAVVVAAYYLAGFAQPERFEEFYSSPTNALSWGVALVFVAAAILAVRSRFLRLHREALRAAAAEAELASRRRYEEALRASEEWLRLVADHVPALIGYVDAGQRYRFANRLYEEWLGFPSASLPGRTVREVWGEERYAGLEPYIERALRGERLSFDYTVGEGAGARRVLATCVPHKDAAGAVQGFFVLGSDVTQLASARSEVDAARERLEQALDGSSTALWDADLRTGRVYLSEAWARIVAAPPGDTVTTLEQLMALVHPEDLEAARRASLEVMKGKQAVYSIDHRVQARTGRWKWIQSRGRVTERDPASGRALRMIGTNIEITERKQAEEVLQSAARSDPLTGLANRAFMMERLRVAIARCGRSGARCAVLFVDVDRFKAVNDTFGHAAGDAVLRQVAATLQSCVRKSDTVARLGGDEFVVLLEDIKEWANADSVAEKVLAGMGRPMPVDGRSIGVTSSIGVAYGSGDDDCEALLERADAALYEAKKAGRNAYRVAPR